MGYILIGHMANDSVAGSFGFSHNKKEYKPNMT